MVGVVSKTCARVLLHKMLHHFIIFIFYIKYMFVPTFCIKKNIIQLFFIVLSLYMRTYLSVMFQFSNVIHVISWFQIYSKVRVFHSCFNYQLPISYI